MHKTIVVHIDGAGDQDSRLRAAARLANEHGAHLVGSAATGVTWLDYTPHGLDRCTETRAANRFHHPSRRHVLAR